jgi:hypothetical protein
VISNGRRNSETDIGPWLRDLQRHFDHGYVTNNTAERLAVTVTTTLVSPTEQTSRDTKKLILKPGQTDTQTLTYTVDASYAKGKYTLSVSATEQNGTSSATASIIIT